VLALVVASVFYCLELVTDTQTTHTHTKRIICLAGFYDISVNGERYTVQAAQRSLQLSFMHTSPVFPPFWPPFWTPFRPLLSCIYHPLWGCD